MTSAASPLRLTSDHYPFLPSLPLVWSWFIWGRPWQWKFLNENSEGGSKNTHNKGFTSGVHPPKNFRQGRDAGLPRQQMVLMQINTIPGLSFRALPTQLAKPSGRSGLRISCPALSAAGTEMFCRNWAKPATTGPQRPASIKRQLRHCFYFLTILLIIL